jgi:hypothetical protein
LWSAEEYYGALIRLATIWWNLHLNGDDEPTQEVHALLAGELSQQVIDSVTRKANQTIEKLSKILTVPKANMPFEELARIITQGRP